MKTGIKNPQQSWREVLFKLTQRSVGTPQLDISDGALGYWAAAELFFPNMRHQRCRVHKTFEVLNKLPKYAQPKEKQTLHEICWAETREYFDAAFDLFIRTPEDEYLSKVQCFFKDKDEPLRFYNFPAEFWKNIRTTNPIASMFATIKYRTKHSKSCLSSTSMLHMIFKLGQCAQKRWHQSKEFDHLAIVIEGLKFKNRIEIENADQEAT